MHFVIDPFILALSAVTTVNESIDCTTTGILSQFAQPGLPVYITLIIFFIGIISTLFGFFGGFVKDYYLARIKGQQNSELEALKADFNRDHAVFIAAIESFSSGQQVSINKRLNAIEIMWDTMQKHRSLVSKAIAFYDTLLPEEYDSEMSRTIINDFVRNYTDISCEANSLRDVVKKHRPFLGELLWNLFLVYDIFLGRLSILISVNQPWTRTSDGKILPWFHDQFMIDLLKPVTEIEKSQEKKFVGSQEIYPHMASWVLFTLEQKILLEADKVISGKDVSDATIQQIKRISDIIRATESTSKLSR